VFRHGAVLLAVWLPLIGASADPSALNIRIVEGEGQAYAPGSRATRGITVEITDESGTPVEAATVTFRLPEEGPGGAFTNGAKTEIATTRPDGRAGVWGMQWNRTAGSFEVRITAARGQARAGTVCALSLSETPPVSSSKHGGHKLLWIALGVAGAAGAGGLAAARGPGGAPTPTPAASITRIGTPTISIGHP
jgi:hypothetical protein